jgi:AcrR family transcriptional regulator
MGIAERREREKEVLRASIVEAARDLLSEEGLGGLSMRAIAERIEYSPSTIYLYFKDKDALIREVVLEGFGQLEGYVRAELESLAETTSAADRHSAVGRAYARFALENTAYFRVMFEVPSAARLECRDDGEPPHDREDPFGVVTLLQQAGREGLHGLGDARRAAVIGWGLIHGLTSLYLSGHLGRQATTGEEFMELLEDAKNSLYWGWKTGRGRGAADESRKEPAARQGGGLA